jgi:hypothetical protein
MRSRIKDFVVPKTRPARKALSKNEDFMAHPRVVDLFPL